MQNTHPFLVHFPIALLSVGILIDIVGAYRGSETMRSLGRTLLALGLLGAIGAVASGLWAERTAAHVEDAHAVMQNHKRLGFVVLALFATLFAWRTRRPHAWHHGGLETVLYSLVGLAAIGTLVLGAKLGGDLVYDYGVGTSIVTLEDDHSHDDTETETKADGADTHADDDNADDDHVDDDHVDDDEDDH